MEYRRDIDGLRALAVVPVVLFHAGVPGFSGGFVGVDVFFVISGYLITLLIAREITEGSFTIAGFYERRVRRIIPALFAVLLVSTVLATRLFLPDQLRDFSKSLVATVLFSSNVFFWREAGYFAAPAAEKPLLHTWSLAVEEQFYIAFPIALLIIHKWLGQRWVAWLAPAALASFALSVWGVIHAPGATFYLAPTRAWELLIGALLALGAIPRPKRRYAIELGAIVGLALIAWAVFGLSRETPFPGLNALYPCVGAALLLHAGEASFAGLRDRACWRHRPLVAIGLISYSLYLWHWPLLVFAQYVRVFELTLAERLVVVCIAGLAAALSWRFVERPFRSRSGSITRKQLATATAMCAAILVGAGFANYVLSSRSTRLPAEVARIASYAEFANRGARRASTTVGTSTRWMRHASTGRKAYRQRMPCGAIATQKR